jgi:hypothetical protein
MLCNLVVVLKYRSHRGNAIAQAVSSWLPSAAAPVSNPIQVIGFVLENARGFL